MDFSKKYVTICQEAQEIQKEWDVTIGDFFYDKDYEKVFVVTGDRNMGLYEATKPYKVSIFSNFKEKGFWLPRQDQLQEVMTTKRNCLNLVSIFYEFVWGKGTHDYCRKFNSCEQLWLSFVMWLEYNKIWDDKKKKWIE